MTDAIVIERVQKRFGDKVAVDGLDLVVPRGGLYGLIGPNGAGKTTSIRIVMSILFPDSGRVSVLGHASALEAKDRIGYLPEERGVYKKMKVGAFLRFIAQLKGVDGPSARKRVREWLERVGLGEVEAKRCEELSKGMQQKIQFVASVIHEPDLLILDEPFSGLDPLNMRLLRDLIRQQHDRGATVIFSTHVMVHAEEICDHVVMIHDGRKVIDDGIEAVRRAHDSRTVVFEPLDPRTDGEAALSRIPGVARVRRDAGRYTLALEDGIEPSRVIQAIAGAIPPSRIEIHRPTLEDIFVRIVAGGAKADEELARLRASLRDDAIATGARA